MKKIFQKRSFTRLIVILFLMLIIFLPVSWIVFQKACMRRTTTWVEQMEKEGGKDRLFIEANEIEKKADEIVSFASSIDGIKLSGSYYDREKNAPVILFFRGLWSSSFVDAIPIYEITKKMNWNLLITTSRAHGESGGNFSTLGVLEKYDCRDWVNWVMEHWGRQTPIFLMGVSMGGATVMMSSNLGLPDSVYGIIDDCGFTTAKEMIRENCKAHLPKFIPSSIFEFFLEAGTRIWGDFDLEQADACKALSQTDIPVLIIHGNEDTKAPLSMAYKLYDSCRSEKEIYIVNGADHAENYQADPEKYGDIIIRFIKKHMSYSQKED